MDQLMLFFQAKADIWQCRSELGQLPDGTPGHWCYALRQKAMWEKCASHAHEAFEKVTSPYVYVRKTRLYTQVLPKF